MSTATKEKPTSSEPDSTAKRANLPQISEERLPYHPALQERFGIDRAGWRALVEAVFPLAQSIDSVILALSYCKARRLDPFKRVVHIVPIYDSNKRRMVDTIWPGIGELRTTAVRTGQYAGRDKTEFGPDVTRKVGSVEMTYPEWAQVTVYRLINGQRVPFSGPQVYWIETYASFKRDDPSPNSMWQKRPRGQLDKCAEAAALRAAFPEEVGNEYIDDEAQGLVIGDSGLPAKSNAIGSRSDKVADILDVGSRLDAEGDSREPQSQADGPSSADLANSIHQRITDAETLEEFEALRAEIDHADKQQMLTEDEVSMLRETLAAKDPLGA